MYGGYLIREISPFSSQLANLDDRTEPMVLPNQESHEKQNHVMVFTQASLNTIESKSDDKSPRVWACWIPLGKAESLVKTLSTLDLVIRKKN